MDITRAGSRPSAAGPDDYFTGRVRVDAPFAGSGALSGATVLIIFGAGRVQREAGQVEHVRPGDIVFFAPNERHWHGAEADCAMSHIAIAEKQDGSVVTWLEKVSDADYNGETR